MTTVDQPNPPYAAPRTRLSRERVTARAAGFHVGTLMLYGLALAVLALEAAPIVMYQIAGTLWMVNDAELSAWSFWVPLKTQLHDSYLYIYAGFGYWASLRLVHTLTEMLLRSPEATLEYVQLYGLLTKLFLFALATFLVVGVTLSRSLSRTAKVTVLGFMVFLVVGTSQLFWMYSARVTIEAPIKLLATVGLLLLLIEYERVIDHRQKQSNWYGFVAGGFFGALFFQESLYSYLAIFFLAVALLGRQRLAIFRLLVLFGVGAVIGGLGELLLFYQGDLDSTRAALVSHVTAILSGVPVPQPDFELEYYQRFLSLDSRYLTDQVMMIGGIVVALATVLWCLVTWVSHRWSFLSGLLLELSVVYLLVVLAHWKIFQTHGSTTTVFSVTIATGLYLAVCLYVLVRAGANRSHARLFLCQVGAVAALLVLSTAYNFDLWGAGRGGYYRLTPTYFQAKLNADGRLATVIRQFDQVLNALAPRYTIVNNDELYWSSDLVAWQDYVAEGFYHQGVVWGPGDLRYGTLFESDRHPRYSVFTRSAVVGVSASCTANTPAVLAQTSAVQGYCVPLLDGTTRLQVNVVADRTIANPGHDAWIVPAASDFSPAQLHSTVQTMARAAIARAQLQPMAGFTGPVSSSLSSAYPLVGLTSDPGITVEQLTISIFEDLTAERRLGWVIVPITGADVLATQSPEAQVLLASGYRPYLSVISAQHVSYQLIMLSPT